MIALPPRPVREPTETDLVRSILVAVNRIRGVRAARNNVGTIEDRRGIPVTFGLGEGSPDIVGVITFGGVETWAPSSSCGPCDVLGADHRGPCTLTPRGVSPLLRVQDPLAVAFALEVKKPKRYATRVQKAWHVVAKRRGLLVALVRSDVEAVDFVNGAIVELAMRIRRISGALA